MTNVYPLKCRISAEAGVTRVDIYDDIGEGSWFSDGMTSKAFAAQMAKAKGPLEVHINSYGGDVGEGIAIGNAIRNHKGPKKTVVDGFAASIASVITQAGDERVVEPGSMMMLHDALSLCVGNAADMREKADLLDKHSDNLADIYAARAGGTAQQWRDIMRGKDTWYTAEEAVAAGLADRVGDGHAELPAGLDVAAFTALPGRIVAALTAMPRSGKAKRKPRAAAKPKPGAGEHVCGSACGPGCSCSSGSSAHVDYGAIRDLVREELHLANGNADEAAWDGPAAMSRASKKASPSAAFRQICAGEKSDGDPDTQAHWALPHHANPGDPPNRAGVTAALGRLNQTQGLQNKAAAQSHLEAHQRAMGSGSDDHLRTGLAWSGPDQFRASLERKDK